MGATTTGSPVGTYANAIGQAATGFQKRMTGADAAYNAALSSYQRDMMSLNLAMAQWQNQVETADKSQIMSGLLGAVKQTQVAEEASLKLDDISMAAQAVQAQVLVQAAANGVEGNSVALATRDVLGKEAKAKGDVRATAESEIESIELDRRIKREQARMQDFYYYEPTAPSKSDYTSGIFGNTALDISNIFNDTMPKKFDEQTIATYGLK